jgi:CRP/FNR family transcriptional regulator, cyclic AMP receptor protein
MAATIPSRIWYLRRLNLFDGMSTEEIEDVGRLLHDRRCEAGEQVWDPDGDRVYILKAGRVRLFRRSEGGQETTTAVLRPGQLFGLGGLLHRGEESAAEAVEPSVICDASATQFLRILSHHPLLMARVTMTMARQLMQMERTIEQLSTQHVPKRVAAILADLADEATSSDGTAVIRQSQTEVAKLAGTTRESAARVVAQLRAQRILAEGRPLRVLDLPRLRAAANAQGDDSG